MKNIGIKVLLLFIVFLYPAEYLSAQTDSSGLIKFSERLPAELVFEVSVKETIAIGFANCFEASVFNVHRGSLKDTKILITVLAGDKKNYETLISGNENTVFIVYCMHHKSNEDYSTAYITGFVDTDKTSWKIISIR